MGRPAEGRFARACRRFPHWACAYRDPSTPARHGQAPTPSGPAHGTRPVPPVPATRRARRPLRGPDAIGVRVGKVLGKYKVGKHFVLDIREDSLSYRRDEEKIAAEAALDGFYCVRTSVSAKTLSSESAVQAYKSLSQVERAFRCLKTIDLNVRPIYHRVDDRIRAHVFLCMLAYYVEWHMRRKLAPILFDDHDKQEAERKRESLVAPAPRSGAAKKKDQSKRTEDDYAVHSFRSLLKDLGTLAKNRVRIRGTTDEFYTQHQAHSRPDPSPRPARRQTQRVARNRTIRLHLNR